MTGSVRDINLGTRELMCNCFFVFQSLFKGRTLIVFIVAFSILYNLVKFFELTTEIKVWRKFSKISVKLFIRKVAKSFLNCPV